MRILLALMMILAGAATAQAQAKNGQRFGDWTLRCVAQGPGQTSCALRQRVTRADTNELLADVSLNMAQVQGTPRVLMVVVTPDGVALNIAPGFIVDGEGDAVNLSWRTCSQNLCRAAALLSPQQQGAVMAGLEMRLGYNRFQSEQTTVLPVSLKGVTAGLAALSTR
ncbi:MAG: invasion associated locus B family protein [Pseudomonadota bacterium]